MDFFRFQTGAGLVTLTAAPGPRGANLHIQLSLYDAAGTLLRALDTPDTSAGVLPVTLTRTVPAGTYYFSVQGIGSLDPLTTGYSDYSSIGQYSVTGTLPSDSTWLPTAAGIYSWTNPAHWTSGTMALGPSATARINNDLLGDQVITADAGITLGRLFLGDSDASHGFALESGTGGSLTFAVATGNAALVKSSGTNDLINLPVQLQSTLVITNSTAADLLFSNTVAGVGGLVKWGSGTVALEAPATFTGATVVGEGTLRLGADSSLASAILDVGSGGILDALALPAGYLVQAGRTLGGNGNVLGDVGVMLSGRLDPGSNSVTGTLTISNKLTLMAESVLQFDLSGNTAVGGDTNDLLVVGGDLVLAGPVGVEFKFVGSIPETPATYTLMTYAGTLVGGASNLSAMNFSNRYAFVFDDTTPGEIRVLVSGTPATNLTWQGDGVLNLWETGGDLNWTNGVSLDQFYQLDHVVFDGSGSLSPSVSLRGSLFPSTVLVDATNNHSFSGSGRISGPASLTKRGSGTLTLNTANDFTGPVSVEEGALKVGNSLALGSTNSGTTVGPGATLDLNGLNLGLEPVTVEGAGASGSGALLSGSASTQSNALRFVTLAGDATIGGVGRWDIRANPTGGLLGNSFNLTKTGANEIWLAELGNTVLGDVTVQQGTLALQGNTTLGNSAKNLNLAGGTSLVLNKTENNIINKRLVLSGSTIRSDAGNNSIAGTITLNTTATNTILVSHLLDIQSTISGAGSILKTGSGMMGLGVANSHTGVVIVSAGTLRPANASALGATNGGTIINAGARLDINGLNLGAEPVTVGGSGFGDTGAIVNYGASQQSAMQHIALSGNVIFGGLSRWDVRGAPIGSFEGNNFSLTKNGVNEIWLANLGPTELGSVTINEGVLGFQGSTTLGNTAASLTVGSAATLGILGTGTNILSKAVTLNASRILNNTGSNSLGGTLVLSGSNRLDVAAGSTLNLLGVVSGSSGLLHKLNSGTLVLSSNNSYGNTLIAAGTVQVGSGGTSGSFGAGGVTNNGSVYFNRAGDFTVANLFSGTGSLTKQNTGVLTLTGSNSYSGLTVVSAGTVRLGNSAALGVSSVGTTIYDGATLDLNGRAAGAETVIAYGEGVGGAGAIVSNSTTPQTNALRYVSLTGNTTFGGVGRWDIRDPGTGASSMSSAGYALTKVGSNQVWLADLRQTSLGDIVVSNGWLVFEGNTSLGVPENLVTVYPDGVLGFSGLTGAVSKVTSMAGGAIASLAGTNILSGPFTATGTNTLNAAVASVLGLSGGIAGDGTVLKTGPGILELGGASSFAGVTRLLAGSIRVTHPEALSTVPWVELGSGTTLDASALLMFSQAPGATLTGNGMVLGDFVSGGTLAPGIPLGNLAFGNNLTLAGLTRLEIGKTGSVLTNGSLTVSGGLSCGGMLQVVHSGDALEDGDSFKLLTAGSFAGAFVSNSLPALAPRLLWDTSQLSIDGTLRVVAGIVPPQILPVSLDGTNLVVSVASENGLIYVLESTPSLAPPQDWQSLSTNTGNGAVLIFPIPIDLQQPNTYFRLLVR